MVRQISFVHEGTQYFTFEGSTYIRSSLNTNAAPQAVLLSKASYSSEMKKLNNGSTRFAIDFHAVKDPVVTVVDGIYNVTGTVEIAGASHSVTLSESGLIIEGLEDVVDETVKEELQVTPVETAQEKVQETVESPETVEKLQTEVEPVVEKTPIEESPAVEVASDVEEAVDEPIKEVAKTEDIQSDAKVVIKGVTIKPEEKVVPTGKPVVKKKGRPVGMIFGERLQADPNHVVLGKSQATVGCVFRDVQSVMYQPRRNLAVKGFSALRGVKQKQVVNQKLEPCIVPQQTPISAPNEDVMVEPKQEVYTHETAAEGQRNNALVAEWARQAAIADRGKPESSPAPIEDIVAQARERNGIREEKRKVPDPLVKEEEIATGAVEVPADREALKKAARAKLSDNVNAIIGDIPIELLSTIEEFTSHPVDVSSLNDMGELFCIDNRWHKQGKWFCIDVIPNAARYFFNARLGVSIEIKIADLRLWANALC